MEHIKDIQISVAHKCIRCGRCIAVCPSDVFGKDNETGLIEVKQKQRCISCGQCVAICPTSSIHHSYFQQKDIHPESDQSNLAGSRISRRRTDLQPQILETTYYIWRICRLCVCLELEWQDV